MIFGVYGCMVRNKKLKKESKLRLTKFISVVILFFCYPAFGASFDCKKAGTTHEKMICTNPSLDELDSKMGDAYLSANNSFPIKGYVRDNQRIWGQEYRRCADIKSCSEILNKRITELVQLKNSSVYADYSGNTLQATEILIIVPDKDSATKMIKFFGAWMPDGRMDPNKMKGYPYDGYICDDEIEFTKKGNLYVSSDGVSIKTTPSQIEMKGSINCGRGGISNGTYKKDSMSRLYYFSAILCFCVNAQAQAPEFICKTEKHMIQIDNISGGNYKYRSWN